MRSRFIVTTLLLAVAAALPAAGARASSARAGRVTDAAARALPTTYAGPCPGVIKFKGKIAADGPAVVKYTWTRSDGATAPVETLVFDAAGSREVETDWRLGDARLLPYYEGWQALKILSPNELESGPAEFVIDCKGGEKDISVGGSSVTILAPTPAAEAVPVLPRQQQQQQQSAGLAAYRSILPELAVPDRRRLERELADLKGFAEGLNARLKGAPKAARLDEAQLEQEFRELLLLLEPGADKTAQRAREFRLRYAEQFARQAEAAGVNLGAERRRLGQLAGIWPADVPPEVLNDPNNMTAARFVTEAEAADNRPPAEASPAPPDSTAQEFRGPYTSSGAEGGERHAVANTSGFLWIDRALPFAGSAQTLAFVTQDLTVEAGQREVTVTAVVNNLEYVTTATALLAGYASAEAIVNLRVLEGARVVASDRVSVRRAVAAVFGFDDRRDRVRSVTLGGTFVRPAPAGPGRYTVVVEFEGWAGAGGLAGARVAMNGTVRPIRVTTRR